MEKVLLFLFSLALGIAAVVVAAWLSAHLWNVYFAAPRAWPTFTTSDALLLGVILRCCTYTRQA